MPDHKMKSISNILVKLKKAVRLITSFFYVIMLVCTVFGLFRQPMPGIYLMGVLFGCLVLSFIFREFCRRGVTLLMTHIAIGVGCFFLLDNPYIRLLVFLVLIGYFVDGLLYIRRNYMVSRVFEAPWPSMLFGIITIMLGYHIGNMSLQRIGYLMPVLIIFMFLLSLYLDGLEEYLNGSRRVSGAPLKQIISVNSLVVAGLLTVFVVTIVLGNVLGLDVVLKNVLKSFLPLLRIIVGIIIFIFKFIFSLLFDVNGEVESPNMNIIENAGTNALGDFLDLFLIMVFILISVAAVILLFRWLIRLLLSRQGRMDDITEELKVKRKAVTKKEKFAREDKLKGTTPDMVARRLYKNKVLSYKRYFIPEKHSTTGDIKELIILRPALNKMYYHSDSEDRPEIDEEKVQLLTEMYEDVRYGEKMPDDDFLRKMKKIKL